MISYAGHASAVRGVSFASDGKYCYSCGSDGKWHRWEIETGKKAGESALGGEGLRMICTDRFALVPSTDHSIRRIDLKTNKESLVFKGHDDWVVSLAKAPGANRLASGSFSGEIRIWDLEDGKSQLNWKGVP